MIKTDMLQYLKDLNEEFFHYFPNPGNAGDCMIAHSSFQLFRACGIKFQICDPNKYINLNHKAIMYAGGGNLTRYHKYASNFIDRVHRDAHKLIILPHTVDQHEALLQKLGKNVVIICREEISFQHVKKYAKNACVIIADDMAFNLDVQSVLAKYPISLFRLFFLKMFYMLNRNSRRSFLPSFKKIVNERIVTRRFLTKKKKENLPEKELNCFRTDIEKTRLKIPQDNLDISVTFAYGTRNEELALYGCHRLLKFINNFDTIKTNRLHIAIAGALLGKDVEFHPNSYFKNKAVWEFSLRNKFSNLRWMG
jgi:exopolysaccharide biosynthesis predicted pyruvyltransferase EpsI